MPVCPKAAQTIRRGKPRLYSSVRWSAGVPLSGFFPYVYLCRKTTDMSQDTPAPLVSVCMPVYNAAVHLRECIGSILTQTYAHFELIVVDDGSDDGSADIVQSYGDPRIRLIRNPHDYIGSLNTLMREARGKYIARMDADDIMLPHRLAAQCGYMEKHPGVGVLGGGMLLFGARGGRVSPTPNVSMQDMVDTCCMAHPTVMIRTSLIRQYGFLYEEEYKYAEDYRLWMEMMKRGVVFRNMPAPLIRYRTSETQVSSVHSEEQARKTAGIKRDGAEWLLRRQKEVAEERAPIPETGSLLTVVIPFLNEGDEVGKTVRSIRNTAGRKVDIIVVDDHSDDGYDYEADLRGFGVCLVRNACRIGAAASKHKGARLCRTSYFILLDAHMRCYTPGWHKAVVAELEANPRQLLCCQTEPLRRVGGRVYGDKGRVDTRGAYVLFDYENYIPGIHWNEDGNAALLPGNGIPCILGAAYATSKAYWQSIRGLEGLMHYGSEETYLSLKAWMEGGGCRLLPDVVFGHIYRAAPPYRIVTAQMHYNTFVISSTLFPTSLRCWANSVAYSTNPAIYPDIMFWLYMNKQRISDLKKYYKRNFHNDFGDIMAMNNITDVARMAAAKSEEKRISGIVKFIAEDTQNTSPCLWNGWTGRLIALCEYSRHSGDDGYEELAGGLFDNISESLSPTGEFPVSFAHGVCGIGWGLIYLVRNGLAEMDVDKELSVIDSMVVERNPERVADLSFNTGIGGILCYVVNRLYLLRGNVDGSAYDRAYLASLKTAAQKAAETTEDMRTRSYALQFLEYGPGEWEILNPAWKDVVDFPKFLPKDRRLWRNSMDSAMGYLCNLLSLLSSSNGRKDTPG